MFTACVDVTCAKLHCSTGIQISHRFLKHNAEKDFGDYRLILHVSASAYNNKWNFWWHINQNL